MLQELIKSIPPHLFFCVGHNGFEFAVGEVFKYHFKLLPALHQLHYLLELPICYLCVRVVLVLLY